MEVSTQKSSLLKFSLDEEFISKLKPVFPFQVLSLDFGLKYLGYCFKPNKYFKEDQNWIVKKLEKRISNQCSHWLSLEGRYILIKYFMKSILIYWLTLAKIPKSIVDRLRKIIFIFLWYSKEDRKKFHLVKWKKTVLIGRKFPSNKGGHCTFHKSQLES